MLPPAVRADRGKDGIERSFTAVRHRSRAHFDVRDSAGQATRERRAHLGRGQRTFERIGSEHDDEHG
jgi:hypothetical protein